MRVIPTQLLTIVAVLLVLSLSAGAAMVFGDENDDDKDKNNTEVDTSSIGGGSRGTLEPGAGDRPAPPGAGDTVTGLGRSGWVLPSGVSFVDGLADLMRRAHPPAGWSVAAQRPDRPPRPRRTPRPSDEADDGAGDGTPAPDPRTSMTLPEPATLSVLLIGGLALLVRRRHRG